MKTSSSALSACAVALAIGASLATSAAFATPQTRTFYTNPTGICQPALPSFEGVIRKRPLAVENVGTTNSFVTCSFTSQGKSITQVTVAFASNDGAAHQVSCTGVTGANGEFGGNQSIVKAVAVPGTGSKVTMTWQGIEFDDGIPGPPTNLFPSPYFGISCNLLPGVGINDSSIDFAEDVGA